jgi:hypothetical protein
VGEDLRINLGLERRGGGGGKNMSTISLKICENHEMSQKFSSKMSCVGKKSQNFPQKCEFRVGGWEGGKLK